MAIVETFRGLSELKEEFDTGSWNCIFFFFRASLAGHTEVSQLLTTADLFAGAKQRTSDLFFLFFLSCFSSLAKRESARVVL